MTTQDTLREEPREQLNLSALPPPVGMPLARLSNITLDRGGVRILENISWEIQPKQAWVVLGPNGCGKSTLLRVLLGYEWPTSGRVELLGEIYGDGAAVPRIRERIGWVGAHLDRDLDPAMSCADVVCTGWHAALGVHEVWPAWLVERAESLLAAAGLAHLGGRPYGRLSSGERQRVMLARALVSNPVLLLLDEPCAGLDPSAREEFLGALSALLGHDRPPAVVYVTHHVEEMVEEIGHALLITRGTVVGCGPVETTLNDSALSRLFGRAASLSRSTDHGWRLHLARDSTAPGAESARGK